MRSNAGMKFDCIYEETLEFIDIDYTRLNKTIRYEQRPHEKWEYLKEHITEMRDADGELNQKQTCQFILNLMGVIEREGETEELKEALSFVYDKFKRGEAE